MKISSIANTVSQNYTDKNKLNSKKNLNYSFVTTETPQKDEVSFKGKDIISKFFGEQYAIKILDKKWVRDLAENLSKLGGNMTEHMATVGSLITSGVYVTRTLTNKNLDNSKKKTLAINQALCFVVPTICAYTVNSALGDYNKELEYLYGDIQNKKAALGQTAIKDASKMRELTGRRLKGFKTLASLLTFTLIYRYATPVIITPIANWIGKQLEERKANKKALAQQKAAEQVKNVA